MFPFLTIFQSYDFDGVDRTQRSESSVSLQNSEQKVIFYERTTPQITSTR